MKRGRARRRRKTREVLAALAVIVACGALVLFASPLHRGYYAERLAASATGDVPRGGALPGVRAVSAPGAPARAVTPALRHAIVPDAHGRLPIPLADPMPRRLPAEGVPAGWELKEFAGHALIELVRGDGWPALRLRSEQASFALYRDVVVDLAEYPVLAWSWKVVRLPAAGDVRQTGRDDQAAQLYVVFPRWPSPRTRSDVIGYVWDTTAPVGTRVISQKSANVRIIVVESGAGALGTWQRQQRDVRQDYEALFGHRPPRVGSIAIMIDANDTGGGAEALVGDLSFSRG